MVQFAIRISSKQPLLTIKTKDPAKGWFEIINEIYSDDIPRKIENLITMSISTCGQLLEKWKVAYLVIGDRSQQ
jgi:hypothetical protein